ncbi:deoxyribose-phosphate aldolase [Aequorivita sp. H23M31]|uniref:Deoxyribose-phosphate aldolase n=1 Tax=Aequorivita ciconiae TaxID=2494375 RepID=A0A410FZQ6_9FLAO|nr:deoxyribose-phosphate aldolase [Aequorivita sp. H23M31]QAA80512.1 deoxyribose-phosphate aldolase [Aequorivita sp. H23M31]
MALNQNIDHTLLKPTATTEDIDKLCEEAIKYGFYAICIHSSYVPLAKEKLKNSNVKIATVVGFPLGASSPESKIREALIAIDYGADEIDMVMNIGFFKSQWTEAVTKEIEEVKKAIGDKVLKVIIETCYLSDDEIKTACTLVIKGGADYVKTSTGFGSSGATEHDVKIMLDAVGKNLKVKASGGIKDAATAEKYVKMGVSRLGTSSGVEIVSGGSKKEDNERTY